MQYLKEKVCVIEIEGAAMEREHSWCLRGQCQEVFQEGPPAAQVSEVKADALEIPTLFSELS